ncbi:MAG: H-NS family nucleoid-associated regulatory protein [Betaproteobacteria bacterium]
MDLSNLTVAQLRELQQQIPAEMKRREAHEKVAVLKELKAFAEARGYSLEQLLAKENKTPVRGKVKVKYAHPDDAKLVWTGRGRKPKWVEQWLSSGKPLEGLLV